MQEAPLNTRTHNLNPEQQKAQTVFNLDKKGEPTLKHHLSKTLRQVR